MRQLSLFLIIFLIGTALSFTWNDETLFSSGDYSILKPNIMFLFDNSGSMNNVIFPPGYNDKQTYNGQNGDFIEPGKIYYIQTKGNKFYLSGDNYVKELDYLDKELTDSGIADLYYFTQADTQAGDGKDDTNTNIGQRIYVYVTKYNNEYPRYPGNLLNYLLFYASSAQLEQWNHFMRYGKWDSSDTAAVLYTKNRIMVAAKAFKEVAAKLHEDYELDPNPDKAYLRLGIACFDFDEGALIKHACQQNSSLSSFQSIIDGLSANAWTPLSEAYAELWGYFRVGGTANLSSDSDFKPFDGGATNISNSKPMTNWCQLNFIVIMTDGESAKDLGLRTLMDSNDVFYTPNNTAPWGDPASGENDNDTATLADDGSNYLDDLAYYAYSNDLYPDSSTTIKNHSQYETIFKNKQFIYTYTIGFAIDNQILADTAEHGGGEYFTANNYETLVQAMMSVFAAIEEKVRAYASFAAPKFSLTYGERRGYVATFVPRNNQNVWEGHAKCFLLNDQGDFPADLENPGPALLWDAGSKLSTRQSSERTIFTYLDDERQDFVASNADITAADLGFTSGDLEQNEADRETTINFIRGDNGYGWKLGDSFHFNPIVVGAPLLWLGAFDASYQDFFDYYTKTGNYKDDGVQRVETVYLGANDGMLHAFRIGDVADANRGEELWAFIPPSHLSRLKHLVPTVTGSNNEHTYFNDGKALAKDIKVSATGTKADWKTMLLFGMGIGGKTYCALNITNPEEPLFMWEFSDPLQGYSEGKPIITRIADDGTGASFPAVIVPGGYDVAETAATTGNLTGKCFYVLHAETGAVIKTFKYGNTTDDTLSSPYIHTNTGFRYAFTAMAAVHDYNNDNVADYMYLTETGDFRGTAGQGARIWKVNLNGSPDNWQPTLIFQAPNFQTMFIPPTIGYDKYFRLWIMFGTGHRPQPDNSSNVTGQFYCFYDDGNISTPYTIADLSNITTYMQGTSDTAEVDLTTKKGLYFNYVNGNKEILFEPNPLFVNFKLFFNTYTPIVSAGPDPCADTGNEWVYILTLDFGLETLEVEEKEIFPGKMHGYGVLTGGDYVVYYGDGEAGGANMHSTRPKDRVDSKENKGLIFWVENFR